MSKVSNALLSFKAGAAALYAEAIRNAAANVGSASAELARFACYGFCAGLDVETVVANMRDGAESSNVGSASVGQYVSHFKRIAAQGAEYVAGIVAERDACQTWAGFSQLIRAYDVPAVSARGRKAGQGAGASTKKQEPEKVQAGVDTLPGMLLAFQSLRAAAPKVTANGEALTLMDQTIALLRRELSLAEKAKAAKV